MGSFNLRVFYIIVNIGQVEAKAWEAAAAAAAARGPWLEVNIGARGELLTVVLVPCMWRCEVLQCCCCAAAAKAITFSRKLKQHCKLRTIVCQPLNREEKGNGKVGEVGITTIGIPLLIFC